MKVELFPAIDVLADQIDLAVARAHVELDVGEAVVKCGQRWHQLEPECQQGLRSYPFLTNIKSVRIGGEAVSTDSTLTSKGQTTIPKDIRETLGMKSGDRMTFTMLPDGTVLMRVKNKSVMSLAGSLRKKGQKPVPVEQLSR
jgi:AbrB family looped-hinge helix DNA binding protein